MRSAGDSAEAGRANAATPVRQHTTTRRVAMRFMSPPMRVYLTAGRVHLPLRTSVAALAGLALALCAFGSRGLAQSTPAGGAGSSASAKATADKSDPAAAL